jgi:hypothetical protein
MQEREVRENSPYKGPSGSSEWVIGHKGGCGEVDREENIWGVPLSNLSCYSVHFLSVYFLPCPHHVSPYVR